MKITHIVAILLFVGCTSKTNLSKLPFYSKEIKYTTIRILNESNKWVEYSMTYKYDKNFEFPKDTFMIVDIDDCYFTENYLILKHLNCEVFTYINLRNYNSFSGDLRNKTLIIKKDFWLANPEESK